jgi:S-sulfo-L-cysteine synthase (3-phospho-L-serine-dependent)
MTPNPHEPGPDSLLVLVESNTTGTGRLFCAAARRLGLRPVVFARDAARYPYLAQDRVDTRVVDTGSVADVLAECARLGGPVVGVASSSEYSVGVAGQAARALGLPHPDPDAVLACRDKYAQRVRLRDGGIRGPRFGLATTAGQAVGVAGEFGYPVVVKPPAGSGSIGVRWCADAAAVTDATRYLLSTDPVRLSIPAPEAVLVEEYLSGAEFSVETFDEQVVGVVRKRLGPHPHFVETGHDFPARMPAAEHDDLATTAVAALRALGLGWGAAHVELRLTDAGAALIEVNPRLAGGMIPRMLQEALGVDLIERQVARAAGRDEGPLPSGESAASIRFLVAGAGGTLRGVDGIDRALRVPGVVEVGQTRPAGFEVVLTQSFQDRVAYVIAVAGELAAAMLAADTGLAELRARIDSGTRTSEGART